MSLLNQIELDATNIINDVTNGYAEQMYFKSTSNDGAGVFFDSWEEGTDPRSPECVIAKTTFIAYDLEHGDLVQRAADSKVFEIYGFKPDPDGTVTMQLRPSILAFS